MSLPLPTWLDMRRSFNGTARYEDQLDRGALDGTPLAASAIPFARELALSLSARVLVMTLVQTGPLKQD